jgi:hypothetical protein
MLALYRQNASQAKRSQGDESGSSTSVFVPNERTVFPTTLFSLTPVPLPPPSAANTSDIFSMGSKSTKSHSGGNVVNDEKSSLPTRKVQFADGNGQTINLKKTSKPMSKGKVRAATTNSKENIALHGASNATNTAENAAQPTGKPEALIAVSPMTKQAPLLPAETVYQNSQYR